MITEVLIGYKGSEPRVISVKNEPLKKEFDDLLLAGGDGFEKIELISSLNGRKKRKVFKKVLKEKEPEKQEKAPVFKMK